MPRKYVIDPEIMSAVRRIASAVRWNKPEVEAQARHELAVLKASRAKQLRREAVVMLEAADRMERESAEEKEPVS
ncbi:hypothetical protein [Jiangella alba]|uniref:Uncharacterized protein n=1 Tax=Jiangella alba TaxID=561176 RepID=A0A1H5MPN9_9ACTN|nr:hypothetical protein [Jiangella alba]SEE91246.1 hypothetical protein SAMN04488561_3321 [Jiangella alba]